MRLAVGCTVVPTKAAEHMLDRDAAKSIVVAVPVLEYAQMDSKTHLLHV